MVAPDTVVATDIGGSVHTGGTLPLDVSTLHINKFAGLKNILGFPYRRRQGSLVVITRFYDKLIVR